MTKQDIEGFLGNPFFAALKPSKDINDEYLCRIFNSAFANAGNYDNIVNSIVGNFDILNKGQYRDYILTLVDERKLVIKQAIFDYLLQEDALKYFCQKNEYAEVERLIKRKQMGANLIDAVWNRILFVINNLTGDELNSLSLIINNDVKRGIQKIEEDFVTKKMKKLKEVIDNITSGINIKCYLSFYNNYPGYHLSNELLQYVTEKHGYKLTDRYWDNDPMSIKRVLSMAILNDESFWDFNNGKDVLKFIALVEEYNSIKQAKKIIDYAFSEVCKDKELKFLYDNKFPFDFVNTENNIIKWGLDRIKNHLNKTIAFNVSDSEAKGLLYPIYSGYENDVIKGKTIFEKFIKSYYPTDYTRFLEIFYNLDNICFFEKLDVTKETAYEIIIRVAIEHDVVGFSIDRQNTRKYLSMKYKEFEDDGNVLGRLYYRLYLIDKYTNELSNEFIHEYLYGMLKGIDNKYNFKSSFVMDTKFRDEKYLILKDILSKHDVIIDDSFKQLYIIALLDRKYATAAEAKMFAELEQFGDSIYELAVDNIVFYNPNNGTELNHQTREIHVNAGGQLHVAQYIGLENAYISKLSSELNLKYYHLEGHESGLPYNALNGNYLADSLEMVIGVVAKEFGIQKALDFATKIITEANGLSKPVIEKFDTYYLYNESKLDKEYFRKIFPSPFYEDDDNYAQYMALSYALNKILKIAIIGNDTIEKRRKISYSLNSLMPGYDKYSPYQVVVSYLYYGIEETITKYIKIVESNYKDKLDK